MTPGRLSALPSTGSTFLGDRRPSGVRPLPLKPLLREFCQDPKFSHHPITMKVDVHDGKTSPDLKCKKVEVGGLQTPWLSPTLDNRNPRLKESIDRIHWNSLQDRSEWKLDKQVAYPSNGIWYEDPLRITEFLNGPCADDELSGEEEECRRICPRKKMKVFEAGTSFDHQSSEGGWKRRDGGRNESSRLDNIITSRKDSIGNKLTGDNTFRSIAIGRTIDARDRDLEMSDFQGQGQGHWMMSRKLEPSEMQSYGRALKKESRRTQATTATISTTSTTADGNSDHITRSWSSRRLHQMRDDSGYKSLETQQQEGKTVTRSLDVQLRRIRLPGQDLTGKSLDSHQSHTLLDDDVVLFTDEVTTGRRNTQKQDPSRFSHPLPASATGTGIITVTDDVTEDDDVREKSGFLTVPLPCEGGSRTAPLAKGRSQEDLAVPFPVPAATSVSGIFPLRSFEALLHRAENYISSAVSQAAENILSASIAVTPYAEATPDKNSNIGPTGKPSSFEDDVKVERSTMTTHGIPANRAGGGVLLPVWSRNLGKRPGKEIDEVKVGVKIGVMRRGDTRTASKRRREWGSRKQLTEACESLVFVDWPIDPPSSGQGQSQGQGPLSHSLDTDRPVGINRCYSSIAVSL